MIISCIEKILILIMYMYLWYLLILSLEMWKPLFLKMERFKPLSHTHSSEKIKNKFLRKILGKRFGTGYICIFLDKNILVYGQETNNSLEWCFLASGPPTLRFSQIWDFSEDLSFSHQTVPPNKCFLKLKLRCWLEEGDWSWTSPFHSVFIQGGRSIYIYRYISVVTA